MSENVQPSAITAQSLKERRAGLLQQQAQAEASLIQAQASLTAIRGAIQFCDQLLMAVAGEEKKVDPNV